MYHGGFLILELVIAMVFISVALVGILDAFGTVWRARSESDFQAHLLLIVERQLNDMQQNSDWQEGVTEEDLQDVDSIRIEREVSKTEIADLYKVKVTVTGSKGTEQMTVYLRKSDSSES
jgi:Tfp pilus assembly protein PilV